MQIFLAIIEMDSPNGLFRRPAARRRLWDVVPDQLHCYVLPHFESYPVR